MVWRTLAPKHLCRESSMVQAEPKKTINELLDKIASDNAELFELLSTNGKRKK
jgi:hypothetical protein